jgi:hypothetical protein
MTKRVTHIGLLLGTDRASVLVTAEGVLPSFELPAAQTPPLRNVNRVVSGFREKIGADVAIVRALDARQAGQGVRVYMIEARSPLRDRRWRSLHELDKTWPVGSPTPDGIAESALMESITPWYRHGFLAEAELWVGEEAAKTGLRVTGPLAQRKHWANSAVCTIMTDSGRHYFKATHVSSHEGRITNDIAERWPDLVEGPLAHDDARGWMLSPEVTGTALSRSGALDDFTDLIARYARLQVESIPLASTLEAQGFPTTDIDGLIAEARAFVADVATLSEGPGGLTEQEIDRLHAQADEQLASLRDLESIPFPRVLEHGDLDSHQVIVSQERVTILDWSEACLSSPFIGLANFLATMHEGKGTLGGRGGLMGRALARLTDPARGALSVPAPAVEAIRDAYKGPWVDAIDADELARLEQVVTTVFPLISGIDTWRIWHSLESSWEVEGIVPEVARQLLGRR